MPRVRHARYADSRPVTRGDRPSLPSSGPIEEVCVDDRLVEFDS